MSMCITWFLQNYFKKIISKTFIRTFPYGNIYALKPLSGAPSSGAQGTCPTCHTIDTPLEVIRIRISKKNREYNGQTNKYKRTQTMIYKTYT